MIVLAALALAAEAVSFPLALPKSTHVEMRVAHTRQDTRGAQTTSGTASTVYDKTIETTANGYRVTLKPLETKLPDVGSAAQQAKIQAAVEGLYKRTFVYAADESLRPTAIEDWPGAVAEMRKGLATLAASLPEAAPGLEGAVGMFARMTPEQAANIMLREDGFLTLPVNAEFEIGKPRTYEDRLPNPLGGPPIKADGAINLERIDQAKGVAVVRWSLVMDPKSTSESIAVAIKNLVAATGKADTPEARAMIDKIKLERSSGCLYEIDLKIGLPTKADCDSKIVSSDPTSGETITRNERWAITQTVKN